MLKWFTNLFAKTETVDESRELALLKFRIDELKVWCSHDEKVKAVAMWLEDDESYPYQALGVHGSIGDFRKYIDRLK